MPIIETEALTLEPQITAHAEEMFVVLSDPAIYEYENEPPVSLEWLRERFRKLETRRSPDNKEQWLNWVIRLPNGKLIGYVQATVDENDYATVAYVLGSHFWGLGYGHRSVQAMITMLNKQYRVHHFFAVLQRNNHRSLRLLEQLKFSLASPEAHASAQIEPGEILMHREILSTG